MRFFAVPRAGGKIAYSDLPGDGPPLLFLAGAVGAASADYAEVVGQALLAARRRIVVDLLGFGYSDRPGSFSYSHGEQTSALIALLDGLNARAVDVVAHSWSAGVAVLLAADRPDLVGRMALAEGSLSGPGGFTGQVVKWTEADYVSQGYAETVAKLEHDSLAGTSPIPGWVLAGLRAAAPHAVHRAACSLRDWSGPSIRDRFLTSDKPRAYLVGARSERPAGEREMLEAAGVRYVTVPNVGHEMTSDAAAFAVAVATALA